MNITVQVLSDMQCCSKISSCRDAGQLCAQMTKLYGALSPGSLPVSEKTLWRFFAHGGQLAVAIDKDENIVGMGMLIFDYKANEATARIEDVAVPDHCRRQGIGRRIMDTLIELALAHQVRHVDLTSNPSRVAANALYDELGFTERETNVRRLVLNT